MEVKNIKSIEEEIYDEWNEDVKRAEIDADRCELCGRLLIHTYELDDAYGTTVRIPVTYCPNCG